MITPHRTVLRSALALACLACLCGGEALVVNPGFEAGMAGWSGAWDKGIALVEEDGGRFARFSRAAEPTYLTLSQSIALPVDAQRIRVSARMRAAQLTLGDAAWMDFRVMLNFKDAAGKKVEAGGLVPRLVTVTPAWRTESAQRDVPPKAASVELVCGFFRALGQADLDDVLVEVVARRAPAAPAAPAEDAAPTGVLTPAWGSEPIEADGPARAVICLNGVWRCLPASAGAETRPAERGWGLIRVPGSWQGSSWPAVLAAESVPGRGPAWTEEGLAAPGLNRMWYRREVAVPAAWSGRRLVLRFAGLGTDAVVAIDGTVVGRVGFPAGEVDLTAALRPGTTATLDVLVVTAGPDTVAVLMGYADDGKQVKNDIRARGLLDDVTLHAMPAAARLADPVIRTSTRRSELTVGFAVAQGPGDASVAAEVLDERGTSLVRFAAQPVAGGTATWRWDAPVLWSPESPRMLTLALRLLAADGRVLDELRQPFGFREFWIDGRDFRLNGTIIRLRPAPSGTPLHAGHPDVLAANLDAYKAMGCNFIELWPGGAFDPATRSKFEYWRQTAELASRKGLLTNGVVPSMRDFLNGRKADAYREAVAAYLPFRDLINLPAVVMWGHSGNVFNSAFQPRNLGKAEIARGIMFKSQGQVDHELKASRPLLAALHGLDPTRPVFAHHGSAGGDIHTSNLYFLMTPLQEREEWLSHWAEHGQRPFMAVEFGEPLLVPTVFRGRAGFHAANGSEPFPTEHLVSQLGPAAYAQETDLFRRTLVSQFRSGQDYRGWYGATRDVILHAGHAQDLLTLYTRNTWRSWRTWGLSGGMVPWSMRESGWRDAADDAVAMPAWTPGRRGLYASALPASLLRPFTDPLPAGTTFAAVNQPTLAWIAGHVPDESGYGAGFTDKTHSYAAGATVRKQLVLINDGERPRPCTGTWAAELDGARLAGGQVTAELAAGEIRFVPIDFPAPAPRAAAANGSIVLRIDIGGAAHDDRFDFRVFPAPAAAPAPAVSLYDPEGRSTRMLAALGVRTEAWTPGSQPQGVLVLGRNSLAKGPPPGLDRFVAAGGRCLMLTQHPDILSGQFGLRVSAFMSRRVFPLVADHPALAGLDATDLRDWAGSSTLLEARPDWFTPEDGGRWSRWFPWAGWRWGGRGAVTSAAIETPHHGGWTPILGCEFDLAWSPLLEKSVGAGRLTVCMLDLEDHVEVDPAARRLAQQLLAHVREAPLAAPLPTTAIGLGAWRGLLAATGLEHTEADSLPQPPALAVIGPEARFERAALDRFLAAGGRALLLAGETQATAGIGLRRAEAFHGSLAVPSWPELRGLAPGDLRWRAAIPAWLIADGCEVGADGLLGRIAVGNGVAIVSRFDPAALTADQRTYLRLTRWRQTRAVCQVLANLGARFSTDAWLLVPRGIDSMSLAIPWRAKLVVRHPAPATFEARIKESFSPEARQLVASAVDDSAWETVPVPRLWEGYGGAWADADGEAVFRLAIDVPAEWAGRDLQLGLGPIQAFDDAFWNGQPIGRTNTETKEWWKHNRSYAIPGTAVRAGRNILAVRVYNDWKEGGFAGKAEDLFLRPLRQVGLWHADYRDDWALGDDPFRYSNW